MAWYTHTLNNGTVTVDYNGLVAELWTCVRGLLRRVNELERNAAAAAP